MKWREPPRLVIHPRIAPRLDIGPVSVMIGSPIPDGRAGKPHVAVVGSSAPGATIVQVLITHDVSRYVTGSVGVLPASIATGSPAIKRVLVAAVVSGNRSQPIDTAERGVFVRAHGALVTAARHFALAAANFDDG